MAALRHVPCRAVRRRTLRLPFAPSPWRARRCLQRGRQRQREAGPVSGRQAGRRAWSLHGPLHWRHQWRAVVSGTGRRQERAPSGCGRRGGKACACGGQHPSARVPGWAPAVQEREAGDGRPVCQATVKSTGLPCSRPPVGGTPFCGYHQEVSGVPSGCGRRGGKACACGGQHPSARVPGWAPAVQEREAGDGRPVCQATVKSTGLPCSRPPVGGTPFCGHHRQVCARL